MPIAQIIAASTSGGGTPPPPSYNGYWTIEFWMKKSSSQTSVNPRVFNVGAWPAESVGYSSESIGELFWTGGSYTSKTMSNLNDTWNHIAVCGTPTDLFIFQNGILFPGNARNGFATDYTNPFVLGMGGTHNDGWVGKIADFHVTRQAKYNVNFTPLTGPMIADPQTALLVSVKNDTDKYRDYSTNNWSVSGTATFDTDTPFSPSAVTGVPYPDGVGAPGNYVWTAGVLDPTVQTLISYGDLTGWTVTATDNPSLTATITSMNPVGYWGIGIDNPISYSTGRTLDFTPPVTAATGSLSFNGSQYVDYIAGAIWALDVA